MGIIEEIVVRYCQNDFSAIIVPKMLSFCVFKSKMLALFLNKKGFSLDMSIVL